MIASAETAVVASFPKTVSVIGAARSGLAAAVFLHGRGIRVFISDTQPVQSLSSILVKNNLSDIAFEGGGHSEKILESEVIVLSPGVPSDLPIFLEAQRRGIPIWAEVELAYRVSCAPYLAVTGSTGKSTTVSLIGATVAASGRPGVVAGNIGLPLISAAPQISSDGFITAELSSFQLENIDTFRPKVACVVNLMKNHLDRYASMDDYCNAKKLMMTNMSGTDILVLNGRDSRLCVWAEEFKSIMTVVIYAEKIAGFFGVWIDGQNVMTDIGGLTRKLFSHSEMKIAGGHNLENACAAAAVALSAGIDDVSVIKGITSFTGLAHRLEFIRTVDGVSYYNDSKATTAESIECALKAFEGGVHLIAGGRDKGCDFAAIRETVRESAKSVILIGEATDRIEAEWQGCAPIFRSTTLADAVNAARAKACSGEAVVLSPGCSSFDMFKSFEQRGEMFRELVQGMN